MVDMNKKASVVLSAADHFSQPLDKADRKFGQLRSAVSETRTSLEKLNKTQQSLNQFKDLGKALSGTQAGLKSARKEIDQLKVAEASAQHVVKQHAAALRVAEQAVLSAAHSYGENSEQVKTAKREVSQLTKAHKAAEKALRKEQSSLKTAEQSARKLTETFGRQSRQMSELKQKLGAAGINVNALGAEELRLSKKTDTATNALKRQAAQLKRVGDIHRRMEVRNAQKGELYGQGIGLMAKMAPAAFAVKQAIDYEGTFADVRKVVDFSDEKEAATYKTRMMKMAGDLGVEQSGLAEIVTSAGQSGIEKDQLLDFARSATKMSVAWDVSAQEAGETMATWRASMGLSQKQAVDLANSTNYLSNNMNAKARQIASVMVRQGSTAMSAGLSYNETAALSASLIAGGATDETASTALKNITGRLTAGYAATGSQKQAMAKIGFDSQELASMMQSDAQGTLIEVFRALQDVSADERGAVISQLFGEEVKGAVSKLVTTMDDKKNGLVAAFGRVANAADRAGSFESEYAIKAGTHGHKLAQLQSKFNRMMVVLGERMLPVLDAVIPPLISVVDFVADFAEANQGLTTTLMGVAAAYAAFKAATIGFKLLKLTTGNGLDRMRLFRERLTRTTDKTTSSADRASRALSRFNRQLDSVSGSRGGGGYESHGSKRERWWRKGKKGGRHRFGGKWGRLAGMAGIIGSGTALSMIPTSSASAADMAMAGADVVGTTSEVLSMIPESGVLKGAGHTLLKGAGKVLRPLDITLSGAALTSAVIDGDNKKIGSTAGDMLGGMGGAAAGAMAGAALGSVVPILGTAVGGLIGSVIGGLGGGELGSWLGENIGAWFSEDKTALPPDKEVAQQTQQIQKSSQQIVFSPTNHITPTGDPQYDERMLDLLMGRMKSELMPLLTGHDSVMAHADVSLTDRNDL